MSKTLRIPIHGRTTDRDEPLDPLTQRALEILIDALLRQMRAEKEPADGHA